MSGHTFYTGEERTRVRQAAHGFSETDTQLRKEELVQLKLLKISPRLGLLEDKRSGARFSARPKPEHLPEKNNALDFFRKSKQWRNLLRSSSESSSNLHARPDGAKLRIIPRRRTVKETLDQPSSVRRQTTRSGSRYSKIIQSKSELTRLANPSAARINCSGSPEKVTKRRTLSREERLAQYKDMMNRSGETSSSTGTSTMMQPARPRFDEEFAQEYPHLVKIQKDGALPGKLISDPRHVIRLDAFIRDGARDLALKERQALPRLPQKDVPSISGVLKSSFPAKPEYEVFASGALPPPSRPERQFRDPPPSEDYVQRERPVLSDKSPCREAAWEDPSGSPVKNKLAHGTESMALGSPNPSVASDASSGIILHAQSAEVMRPKKSVAPSPAPTVPLPPTPSVPEVGEYLRSWHRRGDTREAWQASRTATLASPFPSAGTGEGISTHRPVHRSLPAKSRTFPSLDRVWLDTRELSMTDRQSGRLEEELDDSPVQSDGPGIDIIVKEKLRADYEQRKDRTRALKKRHLVQIRTSTLPAGAREVREDQSLTTQVVADENPVNGPPVEPEKAPEEVPSSKFQARNPSRLPITIHFTTQKKASGQIEPKERKAVKSAFQFSPILVVAEQMPTLQTSEEPTSSEHRHEPADIKIAVSLPQSHVSVSQLTGIGQLPPQNGADSQPQRSSKRSTPPSLPELDRTILWYLADLESRIGSRIEAQFVAFERRTELLQAALMAVINASANVPGAAPSVPHGDRSSGLSGRSPYYSPVDEARLAGPHANCRRSTEI